MKKAALRRVIIYVLVFSLTFTSVSAAIVRPVEVQASAGVMEGWEVFVGILSSLGFFSSSSTAGQTYYDQFMEWVNEASDFDNQVYSMFSNLSSDLVSNGVEQVTANRMQCILCNSVVKLFDRDILLSGNDVSGTFSFTSAEVTYELSDDHLRMVETYTDCKYGIVLECDVNKFIQNRKMSFSLDSKVTIVDKEASDAAIQTYTLNLVNLLKNIVSNWMKAKTKEIAKNKVFVANARIALASPVDSTFLEQSAIKDKLSTQLLLLSHNFFDVYNLGDMASAAAQKMSSLSDGYIDFVLKRGGYTLPTSYLMIINVFFKNAVPSSLNIAFTEDLSGYCLVNDNGIIKKTDTSGKYTTIDYYAIASYSSSTGNVVFNNAKQSDAFSFIGVPFEDYIDLNSKAVFYYVVDFDMTKYFSSVANYADSISYEDEIEDNLIYGSSDFASSADSDIYIPDAPTYDNIVKNIENASSDELDSAIDAAQKENTKALENANDSTASGDSGLTDSNLSILQKILNAILSLPVSILSNLNGDLSFIKENLSSMNMAVDNNLPIIQDVANNGALTVEKVNELVDALNGALEKNGVIGGVNERVDDIAEDSAAIAGAISSAIAGDKSISVSIAPAEQIPEDQDNFNLGFFNILYLLFLILFKIIMIFCHCLELLFTIHSVTAYPYFINNDMIRGLNWIKSVNITGGLLNISLYDFLFALVRIILVFSVIRLIRHYTDRL
mgnify:FL=1